MFQQKAALKDMHSNGKKNSKSRSNVIGMHLGAGGGEGWGRKQSGGKRGGDEREEEM